MDTLPVAQRPTSSAEEYHIVLKRDGYGGAERQPRCGQDRWNKDGLGMEYDDVAFDQFCELVADGRVCERCLNYLEVSLS